ALGLLLCGLLVLIATRPPTYRVERSMTMAAPPQTVFPFANDFRRFTAWSPWQKLDPRMQMSFSGPADGLGAVYEWKGNDDVGQGRMTIIESAPPSAVSYQLEFIEPFASVAKTHITFVPEGAGTKVTWAMEGKNTFLGKAMSLVMNMDHMIGKD